MRTTQRIGSHAYSDDASEVSKLACDQMADAFRPERLAMKHILSQAHHVKFMVQDGRYDYTKACKLMLIDSEKVMAALNWLIEDNSRLNSIYDVEIHSCTPSDYQMVGWLTEQDEQKIVKLRAA